MDEAMRYYNNAIDILKEKGNYDKKNKYYRDSKYVKMAGNCMYNGILVALDGLMDNLEYNNRLKADARKSVDTYKLFIKENLDRDFQNYFKNFYQSAHLYMGYDGNGAPFEVVKSIFISMIEKVKLKWKGK